MSDVDLREAFGEAFDASRRSACCVPLQNEIMMIMPQQVEAANGVT